MYALDTNSVIYFFKGMGRVAERLLAAPPQAVAVPAIVFYELEVGAQRSPYSARRRAQLAELGRHVNILPFGEKEARAAAEIRASLDEIGQGIGPLDTLIAGTAVARGATLVTHNIWEFGRVRGLFVEDWF